MGTWIAWQHDTSQRGYWVTDSGGQDIATLLFKEQADLIAAAPETATQRDELLKVLQAASDLMWSEEYNDSLNIIDDAIAKAKGESLA